MTDRADVQRARRYIVEVGMTRFEFRSKFPAQFVRNNEVAIFGPTAPQPQQRKVVVKGEKKLTKRVKIRNHYYVYNKVTHRIAGKWHGSKRNR